MQNSQEVGNLKKSKSDLENTSIDLNAPGIATAVAKRIKEDIDGYCIKAYDGGHRWHLGASIIGKPCSRYLWFVFRWALHEKFTGRMQRLFNRGHREEARFVEWLRGIGFEVWDTNANGEQHRMKGCNGHFGGSLDGIGRLPKQYNINEPLLLEFKTNGTGAGFNKLAEDGMPIAKPQHYAQTSTYGYKYGFSFCAYLNINKNDDDLHVEITKLDHNLGTQMEAKAERIITAQVPPPRISDNATYFECKYCAMKDICHFGAKPEKNCRSCKFASPAENAEWFCNAHNNTIPREFVPIGCGSYEAITEIK